MNQLHIIVRRKISSVLKHSVENVLLLLEMRGLKSWFLFLEDQALQLLLKVDAVHQITANAFLDNKWIAEF